MTELPFDFAANDPRRSVRRLPRVRTLADPPDPPALSRVDLLGYAVLRDNDGLPFLQPTGMNPPARYVEVFATLADAREEAADQLTQAWARHTYEEDARHVAVIVISSLMVRDFRPVTMSSAAIDIATDHLAHEMDEPWCRLALDSEAGLILPWRPATASRTGSFVVIAERFLSSVDLPRWIERLTFDDLPLGEEKAIGQGCP